MLETRLIGSPNIEYRFRFDKSTSITISGLCRLKVSSFVAKIGEDNTPSIKMFENKFKYAEESRSAVFKEVTLLRPVDDEFKTFITALASHCEVRDDYDQLSQQNNNNTEDK